MIKVSINNICAKLVECEPLTSGMIGNLVEVSFSSEWDSLNKIAVFSNGDVTKDLFESQWNGNYIPIPQEVLSTPHRTISMGIYGYEIVDGEKVLAIPTIVAEIGKTKFGADPSNDPAADPTLPIWAQLQWEIDHFEIDEQQIAEQVQAYLEQHPVEIPKATASVLGGVKVGEGLSVTADGTLSTEVTAEDIDELANIVDGKADAADIPSLDGYATENWVESKGYLTQHQSLAGYATESYVQNYHDNTKQDAITDLATIRSGAALGTTAVQPDDLYTSTLVPDFTNQLPISTDAQGEIYNTLGYKFGVRLSLSTGEETEANNYVTTGFIPLSNNGIIRFDGFELRDDGTGYDGIVLYDATKNFITGTPAGQIGNYYFPNPVYDEDDPTIIKQFSVAHYSNVAYCRIVAPLASFKLGGIITVNEEITYSETGKKFLPDVRLDYSQIDNVPEDDDDVSPILPLEHLNIAYSEIYYSGHRVNTLEHFENVCKNYGFNALKCDLQPTSDGKLICCHDAGFSLDGSGYITTYNAETATPIYSMTAAECVALSFDTGEHPCLFTDFLAVCRKYGKVAYPTIRGEHLDVVIPELLRCLKAHSMMDAVIVNSLQFGSLANLRNADSSIAMNYTLAKNTAITNADIDSVVQLGNCMLCAWHYESATTSVDFSAMQTAIDYAHSKNVRLLEAQIGNATAYNDAIAKGFDGGQITYGFGSPVLTLATLPIYDGSVI